MRLETFSASSMQNKGRGFMDQNLFDAHIMTVTLTQCQTHRPTD